MIDLAQFEGHTNGPWTVHADECHFHTMSEVRGGKEYKGDRRHHFIPRQLIVQVGGQADFREQEANARLIASAPDLLAEVVRLRKQLAVAVDALAHFARHGFEIAGEAQGALDRINEIGAGK
jgi:hypothetical protein